MSSKKDPVDIIQHCQTSDETLNIFDKENFIQQIEAMGFEDFNSFCKHVLHLQEFYDWNCYVWATDKEEVTHGKENLFWQPGPIDFDAPISFRRVRKGDG